MLNVGLTGGIASGKSTVVRMLLEKGGYLIDHDQLAHLAYEPGGPSYRSIIAAFGFQIVGPGGHIDRKKLGSVVFHDDDRLKQLNGIVHPVVLQSWEKRLMEIEAEKPDAVCISDVPLLIEVGWQNRVDLVLHVYASPRVQVERIMKRDGHTEGEARARVASQMPMDEKRRFADLIIENNGTLEELQKQVDAIWVELVKRESEKRLKYSGE